VDLSIIHSSTHCTLGFIQVGTIIVLALGDQRCDLGEVAIQFFGLGIPKGKGSPSRRISHEAADLKREQLTDVGGVLTFIPGGTDRAYSQSQSWLDCIQQTGFTDPRWSSQNRNFTCEPVT
jgi:hypothetical protein